MFQMVYKYKRKTNQAKWSEDAMMLAIADCNAGVPVKATAKKIQPTLCYSVQALEKRYFVCSAWAFS